MVFQMKYYKGRCNLKNNYLFDDISNIQKEYCLLLSRIREQINEKNATILLREISVFWFKHRKVIDLYAEYYFAEQNSFIYFGPYNLPFSQGKHLPFLLFGKIHLVDDCLCFYGSEYDNIEKVQPQIYTYILQIIEETLEVMNSCGNNVLFFCLCLMG